MKLQMQAVHFNADQKLLDFIQKRANKLDNFYDRIIDGEVIMRVAKDTSNENKMVEVKLNIPGSQLFAKEQSKSFEAATDLALSALKRQLQKFKDKKQSR